MVLVISIDVFQVYYWVRLNCICQLNTITVNDTVNLIKIIEFFRFYSLQRLPKKKMNNVLLNVQVN